MPHERFMRAALRLARKGLGHTSPNPAVGAVIVRGGRVVASGFHSRAGMAHAEIEALSRAKAAARGAAMYVTLEPCCHHGRTGPCTEAIIRSGISKVVVGAPDPNPKVDGRGVRALRAAGIEVVTGVLAGQCAALNEAYSSYISSRLPFVTLKLASSLDGRIATEGGESRWITGAASRRLVHAMRGRSDAVLVGKRTVLEDDPELTVRLAKGKDPVRVVLDSSLETPVSARVYSGVRQGSARLVIFVSRKASAARIRKAEAAGAEVIKAPASIAGLSLRAVLRELGSRELTSVLVEGGGALAASFIRAGLVDKYALFYGPLLLGGEGLPSVAGLGVRRLSAAPRLERVRVRSLGGDIIVEGYPAVKKKGG